VVSSAAPRIGSGRTKFSRARRQVWNAQFYGYWMHRVLDSEGDWFKADVHVQRHLVSSYKVDSAARKHQTMEAAFTVRAAGGG
jgi:hypothetical protein